MGLKLTGRLVGLHGRRRHRSRSVRRQRRHPGSGQRAPAASEAPATAAPAGDIKIGVAFPNSDTFLSAVSRTA